MFKIIRSSVFIILSVLIFIFNESILEYLNYVVAGAMFAICGFDIFDIIKERDFEERRINLVDSIIVVGLGILLLFLHSTKDFAAICVIWCLWSFFREGRELAEEVFVKKGHLVLKIVNAIESIVVIVFSVLLLLDIGEHHAHVHVILLGFEFLFAAFIPLLEYIFEKREEEIIE